MFDHMIVHRALEKFTDNIDNPLLNRAWELLEGMMIVHGTVDCMEGQTITIARSLAWKDFCNIFMGEAGTHAMVGMAHEFHTAIPEAHEAQFHEVLRDAWDAANREPKKKRSGERTKEKREEPLPENVIDFAARRAKS